MTAIRRSVATLAVAALAAGPLALVTASPAAAAEREGRCDGASFDFEVEREDGRFDVSVDIDDAPRGSAWKVVLRQDGRTFTKVVRRADSDGDVEVDRDGVRNTRGSDRFVMRINKVGTSGGCSSTITFRR